MSQTKASKKLLSEALLGKAATQLGLHELAKAEASYRQTLKALKTAPIRKRIREDLETYFEDRQETQDWQRAEHALAMLQNLGITGDKKLATLRTGLLLRQAEVALDNEHLDIAFECFRDLEGQALDKVKELIKTYIRDKADQGDWAAGDDTLERLMALLPDDVEAIFWRANWLFRWAEDLTNQMPTEAERLCRAALEIAPMKTPVIDLGAGKSVSGKDVPDLRQQVSTLLGEILITQTRTSLIQPNLTEAEQFFSKALALDPRPERSSLIKLAMEQTRLDLQADRPIQAFRFLKYLHTELTDEERVEVRDLTYQFSRLYAGREYWKEAKQVFQAWQEGLELANEDVAGFIDALNSERLIFVKASRRLTPSNEEIDRQKEEVEVAEMGLEEAGALKLDTKAVWTDAFIQSSLTLGQSYLVTGDLNNAVKTYGKILKLENLRVEPEDQISQSLHSYSKRMTLDREWDLAIKALKELKKFNLAAPDRQTPTDPRVDGAIHGVILRQAETYLKEDRITEAFDRLQALPDPDHWPVGRVKKIVQSYSQKCPDKCKWTDATMALGKLDDLLYDKEKNIHDQEALRWLVDKLADYGEWLVQDKNLNEAAKTYFDALDKTRKATQTKKFELADKFIQVTRRIAQRWLKRDLETPKTSNGLDEAIKRYEDILAVDELTNTHEQSVNEDLRKHAFDLAQVDQAANWFRAHQTLNKLDELYPDEPKYKTLFAAWRRELYLREVKTLLEPDQLGQAKDRLLKLKKWWEDYDAPEAAWADNAEEVRKTYSDFYDSWLENGQWDLAEKASEDLALLFPDNSEFKGWQVKTYYEWGRFLEEKDNLNKALDRYQQALDRVEGQNTILEPEIQYRLLKTRLAFANQYLEDDKPQDDKPLLEKAVDIYWQALGQPGDYPNRDDDIREALKRHSEKLSSRTPPEWDNAKEALGRLSDLKLYNEQVLKWHQELILLEVKEWLYKKDNVKEAFNSLKQMSLDDWPMDDIMSEVHEYSLARAQADTWSFAVEALESLGEIVEDAKLWEWVADELENLGDRLTQTKDKLKKEVDKTKVTLGAKAAYDAMAKFSKLAKDS